MTADAAAAEVEVCAADGFESGTESPVSFLIESLFPCRLLGECLRGDGIFLKTLSAIKSRKRWA